MEQQHYELAFHLDPNLEESQVQEIKNHLEQSITGRNGNIVFLREPEKTRLSYAIQHKDHSFFGYIQFTIESSEEALSELNNELRLNTNVLRHLIIKVPSPGQRREAVLKQVKARERAEKRVKEKAATPEQTKEMEEKLEDILGNL